MKVVKRDGSIVEYDASKIAAAIEKANHDVLEEDRIGKKEIGKIINYIEKLDKKRMLVEDIQDVIEFKLMEFGKYTLAKKYIVYRYNRALVRRQNTTDESILTIIKGKEIQPSSDGKKTYLASTQRDFIAGEVSKDLTKRILLPDKINEAHEKGVLYFHDMDYFLQPILNCSSINLSDMLDHGTVINGKRIEQPKSFLTACTILTQILATVESGQSGGESISIHSLAKYVDASRKKWSQLFASHFESTISKEVQKQLVELQLKKEIEAGIQTIQYQINTLMTSNGKTPSVTLFLDLEEEIENSARIIEEILKQRYEGMKDAEGKEISPDFPELVYVLDEKNNLTGGKYDFLTRLALKCSQKRKSPWYLSKKKMEESYGSVFSPIGNHLFLPPYKETKIFEGRFNQGIVTLNLAQIALLSQKDEMTFLKLLEERLDLCFDALMRKHYSLLGTHAIVSPIHFCYGAISRLSQEEKIDFLLKQGYSTLTLGIAGFYEAMAFFQEEISTNEKTFPFKVLKKISKKLDSYQEETSIAFTMSMISDEKIRKYFLQKDLEQFGYIEQVTDKDAYEVRSGYDFERRLLLEETLEKYFLGGFITYMDEKQLSEERITYLSQHHRYVGFKIKS